MERCLDRGSAGRQHRLAGNAALITSPYRSCSRILERARETGL
jgi:hypothetical protein